MRCPDNPSENAVETSSGTERLEDYCFRYEDYIFHLVDTHGFDDSTKSDTETPVEIATWTAATYRSQKKTHRNPISAPHLGQRGRRLRGAEPEDVEEAVRRIVPDERHAAEIYVEQLAPSARGVGAPRVAAHFKQ